MTFLERFKGKMSYLSKLGLSNNLELQSSPIEKRDHNKFLHFKSKFIEKLVKKK